MCEWNWTKIIEHDFQLNLACKEITTSTIIEIGKQHHLISSTWNNIVQVTAKLVLFEMPLVA